MRAFLLAAIFAAGVSAPAWGQSFQVPHAVLELGVGTNEGYAGRYHGRFGEVSPQGFIEGRLHFGDSWDFGLQLLAGEARNRDDGYRTEQVLMTFYVDYTYRARDVSFFAGVGFGTGYVNDDTLPVYTEYYVDEWGYERESDSVFNQMLFSPRVGVELWDRLRLTADWKFMTRGQYSTMGFNVGFLFGRRRARDMY